MTKIDLRAAKMNWINFANMALGRPKRFEVKIKRSAEAKKYPLLTTKKDGDVGYDLPNIVDVTIKAPSAAQRESYNRIMVEVNALYRMASDAVLDKDAVQLRAQAERLEATALEQLPQAIIPTGIKLEMPNNIWCTISARSSASRKMLITPDAIIDAGYRGELFAVVFNIGFSDMIVGKGERVCQVIFHERVLASMREVDALGSSERAETGFGSTGN